MEKEPLKAAAFDPAAFFSLIGHPVKFRLYLLKNLPAAYFSGLRIERADAAGCTVTVPYKWFTRNPFRSTYFACLSMAAELSTGVLAMAQVYRCRPAVSLLVTGIEGKFYKKATGPVLFHCTDGKAFREAVSEAVESGMPQQTKAHSVGRNESGETVAEFWITWSFKRK